MFLFKECLYLNLIEIVTFSIVFLACISHYGSNISHLNLLCCHLHFVYCIFLASGDFFFY